MLYAIYGNDSMKVREKLSGLIETLQNKRPDANVFRMRPENWNEAQLNEFVSGINLFAPKNIIVLDSLISNKPTEEAVVDRISEFADSEHVCIIVEPKLTKGQLGKIEKRAVKVQECALPEKAEKKESPRTFALVEALVMKDKKRAWTLFQSIASEGTAAEEIHGVVWWQFKSVKLTSIFGSAKEAGLNPYVYQKSKAALREWPAEKLDPMLKRLVLMYHKAHRGECDFMSELEMLCLE